MNAKDASSYLSLSLSHPDLPSFFKTEEGKARLHHLIKPYETTVTAKSISAKSRTSYHRFKLQKRKNSNSDITSIESKLAQMINTTKVRSSKYLLIKKHQLYKETRDKMLEFYCYSSWTRRKNRGRRFKDKAYSTSARKIIRNADTEGNVVFYSDSGRENGSWIKGYEKRSTYILQKSLSSRPTVLSTTEYLSSKLCCICNEPFVHPKKNNGKVNLGAVLHVNPDCIGRQNSYAIKSRDTNAAVDILKLDCTN